MVASVNQYVKPPNGFFGTANCRVELRKIWGALITPENSSIDVFSGFLKPVHALQNVGGGFAKDMHIRRVVPETLGNLRAVDVISGSVHEAVGQILPAAKQPIPKDFHLAQNHQGKAACCEPLRRNSIRNFRPSLPRCEPVACSDSSDRQQRLRPRGPDLRLHARGANEPWAVKRVSHMDFLSVVEPRA